MTKTIDTLVEDIYKVVQGKGGWDRTVSDFFSSRVGDMMVERLGGEGKEYVPSVRMSNVGKPCSRQLYYDVNNPVSQLKELSGDTHLKFIFGDIIEELIIALVIAAGHTVEGEQDLMELGGIKGHRDCVIDGVLVDIKSASPYAFKHKFVNKGLQFEDDFGYLTQLASYLKASEKDPLVKNKEEAAFLVMNKVTGELHLDVHYLVKQRDSAEKLITTRLKEVNSPKPPLRGFSDKAEGSSGNRVIDKGCTFCVHKAQCWPGLRTFQYSTGPKHFTKVVKRPQKHIKELP